MTNDKQARASGAGIVETLRGWGKWGLGVPANELAAEAASHIEAQDAEIARLRAALAHIQRMETPRANATATRMAAAARAALAPQETQE